MLCHLIAAVTALTTLAGTQAKAADHVVFSLNWIPYGLHYGIFAAEALGYYHDANIDVDIQRGYGSGDTVKRTATGAADLGMADMASVIVGRSNNFPVKQLAVLLDRSADAVYFVKGIGIETPKTLEGHTLGATVGETALNLFPVFAANAGFDNKKVEFVNLAAPAKYPTLVSRKVDSIVAFTTEEPAIKSAAEKGGVELGRFLYSDYGVDYYSIGLIATDEALSKKADVIRRMVDATMRGYAWAIKNPETAADVFVKRFPESSRELTLAQWRIVVTHVLTERTREHGLGYIDRSKMEKTLELIKKYQDIKGAITTDDLYSPSFLKKIEIQQ